MNNSEIRRAIDAITSKVVLILGRFTPHERGGLDAIRTHLRHRAYVPVLFDFDKPSTRDITETISTLAHIARFIIADVTAPRSVAQELMAIVPSLPSVPLQPLRLAAVREYGMFEHFKKFPWVLTTFEYENDDHLMANLDSNVIALAEEKARELTEK